MSETAVQTIEEEKKIDPNDAHHWSGWPGAFCYKCFHEDPVENAWAQGKYDPELNVWESPEVRESVIHANICPVKGILVWDTVFDRWNLKQPDGEIVPFMELKKDVS